MIKTETEYKEVKKRIDQEKSMLKAQQIKLKKAGLTKNQIHLALDPLASFSFQMEEEILEYETLMRGVFTDLINLRGIGRTLIALRISKGLRQNELAEKLGVKESQVSRDETNEYHGASIEKVQRVLDAIGVSTVTKINPKLGDVA